MSPTCYHISFTIYNHACLALSVASSIYTMIEETSRPWSASKLQVQLYPPDRSTTSRSHRRDVNIVYSVRQNAKNTQQSNYTTSEHDPSIRLRFFSALRPTRDKCNGQYHVGNFHGAFPRV